MDYSRGHHQEISAATAKAREDPHTHWVVNLFEGTSLPLLILCLLPCMWLAWKSETFRSLSRSALWGWAGLFAWHVWMGGIVSVIVVKWTGKGVLAEIFPSTSILPIALLGWLPGLIVSIIACSLGILYRLLHGIFPQR